jgi:alpha,alpha-trehalase
MDPLTEFEPQVLRDYAFMADGERGALIGPKGDMAWLCVPNWDSDAVFSTLIGGAGCYAITPIGRFVWGGYYEPRSLIWNSHWVTADGIVESREALALPANPHVVTVLRRLRALDKPTQLRAVLDVRAAFGAEPMVGTHHPKDGICVGRSGPIFFRWSGMGGARRRGGPLVADIQLAPGQVVDLVLELSDQALHGDPPDPESCWNATAAAWDHAVPELAKCLAPRDAEMAMAVLHGMTSAQGGMVAAATMSLPEHAKSGRNYDYRYAWIRDQCYAGRAVGAHGHFPLLDSAVSFVSARLLADGPELKPAYTVAGRAVPDERSLPNLKGYPGGSDKVGNWVNKQFQLDAFGEALELFAAASELDRLGSDHWDAVEIAVSAIERRWQEPDAGIWELDNQRWAHSRLTCVSGLRSIAKQASSSQSGTWSSLADTILADVSADCLHADSRWQRSPTDPRVDASLLMASIRHAVPGSDPRSVATVKSVVGELLRDDYVYRFAHDARPLGQAEGAFLLCGFIAALALQQQGDYLTARALFERTRSACGTPGLFAEEFDVSQRQLRGNVPQAFVHALLLECSAVLTPDESNVAG